MDNFSTNLRWQQSFSSSVEKPKFTEWQNLDALENIYNIKRKAGAGKIAIVLKTGMCTWYCGYKKKEDFPGRILLVTPEFWSGTSMPNDQLKEAIKALGYFFLDDTENAVKQVLEYCQALPAKMVYNLHTMHYDFKLNYLGTGLIDDYGIMGGIKTLSSRTLTKQDELLAELKSDIKSFKEEVKQFNLYRKENRDCLVIDDDPGKEIAEVLFRKKLETLFSLEEETVNYITEAKKVQDLLPFDEGVYTLKWYEDRPGSYRAVTVDEFVAMYGTEEK